MPKLVWKPNLYHSFEKNDELPSFVVMSFQRKDHWIIFECFKKVRHSTEQLTFYSHNNFWGEDYNLLFYETWKVEEVCLGHIIDK